MKRYWLKAIVGFLTLALLMGVSTAVWAGQYNGASDKFFKTIWSQGTGVLVDVPGVVLRGGDRYNVDMVNWYFGILSQASVDYLTELAKSKDGCKEYAGYTATVAKINTDYDRNRKKSAIDRRVRDQKLAIAWAHLNSQVAAANAHNAYFPVVKYDTFGMKAKMIWGGIKGGLNYDWQMADRAIGLVRNLATLNDSKDYAPGQYQTGPISSYMWESDLANVIKLGGIITGPVLAYQSGGVALYFLNKGSGAAAAAGAATLGLGGQLATTTMAEAYKRCFR